MKLSEKLLANISVASVCALLWIWVLPGTIALRHGLLGIGCIAGIFLIKENWTKLFGAKLNLIPLFLIGSLFVWVGFHYLFFSLNPGLELSEIKGLWVRTLAGFIMAIGLGISLSRYVTLRKYFYFSIFAVPLENVTAYLYDSYLQGKFLGPAEYYRFIFTKIEAAYFGGIAIAVAAANLIYLFSSELKKPPYSLITLYFSGIVLALLSDILSNTKNGIAIGLGLCVFLSLIILVKTFLNFKYFKKSAILLGILIVALASVVWQGHQSLASKGWDTILPDIRVAVDIDKNTQWQKREGTIEAPLNSLGVPAALNTYERFAYMAVGLRLIDQYPFGYGSVNRSFNGMQDYAKIPHEHTGQVHSGWIDFGLGFGLPGLGLLLLTLVSILYFGLRQKGELPWIAILICMMLLPFGFIAEISYKQYFEATLFFMTFSAAVIALAPSSNASLNK